VIGADDGRLAASSVKLGLLFADLVAELQPDRGARSALRATGRAIGDLADAEVDGSFFLILVIGDTLNMLPTQEAQRRCLERFAGKLLEDGSFVIEGAVRMPDVRPEGSVGVQSVDADEVRLVVSKADPATQALRQAHVILRADGIRIIPVFGRHVPLGELDLMAALAGVRLRERWGDWQRAPFIAQSRRHVSIYARA
jgi:hypothetical protein